MSEIRTALLSVYDKTGLVELATGLARRGVRLVSTGGTARALREGGLEVVEVGDLTGSAEMLGGRVKTLHPTIFAGILARRDDPAQMRELADAGIDPIDLVVVNLYPFSSTVAVPDHTLQQGLEQVDIGGVSLLRAAMKNFPGVAIATDPGAYDEVLEAVEAGTIPLAVRLRWARRSAAHTAGYEAAICNYLAAIDDEEPDLGESPTLRRHPRSLALTFALRQSLRYGENPHQEAAFYAAGGEPVGAAAGEQLQGKELSFNNILDLDAAWQVARALDSPGAVVMKHGNPCGAAINGSLEDAYVNARATDPLSAFGGIVGVNSNVDRGTAEKIVETFIEAVVAPGYESAALEVLATKKNLRVMRVPEIGNESLARVPDYRWVAGGLLAQDRDLDAPEEWQTATRREPTDEELAGLRFAWQLVPFVRSNAVILARSGRLLGVGAGQMSRVDSCRFAAWKATEAKHDLAGSAAASDAFFPFSDGVEALAEAGVTAVVQPGGSMRDAEVVEAADRLGMVMVLTGARHFRH